MVFRYIDHLHGLAGGLSLVGTMCVTLIPRIVLAVPPIVPDELEALVGNMLSDGGDEVAGSNLHPCHLLAYHGNWYVLAWNVAKDHIETFALSRFRRIEVTGQAFTRPADFNPETYARQAFGIVGGEEPIKVRLLFEAKLAVYITERQWHPSQEFRTRSDGCVEMRLETTGRKELVRWVLSWMPDVKVLAPKSLRDRIAEKLRDGLRAQE